MDGSCHSSWISVECGHSFENVGAFCSDFIPNNKSAYGSKQFEVFGLHFEVFGPRGSNFRGVHFYHDIAPYPGS